MALTAPDVAGKTPAQMQADKKATAGMSIQEKINYYESTGDPIRAGMVAKMYGGDRQGLTASKESQAAATTFTQQQSYKPTSNSISGVVPNTVPRIDDSRAAYTFLGPDASHDLIRRVTGYTGSFEGDAWKKYIAENKVDWNKLEYEAVKAARELQSKYTGDRQGQGYTGGFSYDPNSQNFHWPEISGGGFIGGGSDGTTWVDKPANTGQFDGEDWYLDPYDPNRKYILKAGGPNAGTPTPSPGTTPPGGGVGPGPGGGGGSGGGSGAGGLIDGMPDIGNRPGPTSYTPNTYEAFLSTAERMAAQGLTVTPEMLVNTQLAGIMQSPVGQIAMDIAREQMNSRGMMNSSAAMNAIVQAAIKAGLPIAEKDAATYYNAAQETMSAENAAREANMTQANNMAIVNAGAVNAQRSWNASTMNEASQFNITNAENRYQFDVNATFKKTEMMQDDYWKQQQLAQEKYEFQKNIEIDKYNAETNRLATEANQALSAAQTDAQRTAIRTQLWTDLWSSGMPKDAAAKAIAVYVADGLMTPEMGASFIANYTGPVVTVT